MNTLRSKNAMQATTHYFKGMNAMNTLRSKTITALTTLATGLLLSGSAEAVEETSWASVKSSVEQELLQPAAKKGGNGKRDRRVNQTSTEDNHISGDFNGSGGKITVKANEDAEWMDGELKIMFEVPGGALERGETIDMTIHGSKASDLVIDFGPSGLVFKKSCTLKIDLGPSLVDINPKHIEPWHQHGDGSVDDAGILEVIFGDDGSLSVKIAVDGFSRYGIRRH